MATKTFCDRCGNETKPGENVLADGWRDSEGELHIHDEDDFCGKCYDAYFEFKEGKAIAAIDCRCRRCIDESEMPFLGMIVCPTCGNKRCPHANDHRNECTDSNEPGQPGSAY